MWVGSVRMLTSAPVWVLRAPLRLTARRAREQLGHQGSELQTLVDMGIAPTAPRKWFPRGGQVLFPPDRCTTGGEVVTSMGFSSRGRRTSLPSTFTVRRVPADWQSNFYSVSTKRTAAKHTAIRIGFTFERDGAVLVSPWHRNKGLSARASRTRLPFDFRDRCMAWRPEFGYKAAGDE